jgi:hypothetical protein
VQNGDRVHYHEEQEDKYGYPGSQRYLQIRIRPVKPVGSLARGQRPHWQHHPPGAAQLPVRVSQPEQQRCQPPDGQELV